MRSRASWTPSWWTRRTSKNNREFRPSLQEQPRMALTLGVNVIETDGKAAPSIQAAATSVGAFVIRSERGAVDAVRRVSSPGQFRELFGGVIGGAFGALA